MIEVTAKLVRGPLYLAGETVECRITFHHPVLPSHSKSQSNTDAFENLAWASAQIHCQCLVNEAKVRYPEYGAVTAEQISTSNTECFLPDTSFAPCRGDRGHVVFSTKPVILFCDLRLTPGESKTFVFKEKLPNEAPPSYRGLSVKYSYKITVGTQRVNSAIKLLKVPLRVLVVTGVSDVSLCADNDDLAPSSPFIESKPKESPLEIAMQLLQNITARRYPYYFNITNSKGNVVRFCIFKLAYKLGEDIVGTFDFSEATIPCVQFSVTLQSEEEIEAGCQKITQKSPSVVSYNKCHEFCISLKYTQLVLPIPLHVTPDFTSDVVSLKWRLHFEFVTTSQPNISETVTDDSTNGTVWQGPSSLDIETMIWNLPIKIYPTMPANISQVFQSQSKCSIVI
ncbi:RAB6A-GEF complex partner protein 2 isoform X1 [Ischnura elegans]|uniref:RAB6A-GEF complex partner protein 2 isoform X1 n=1 Tax=Ischnura elegans TaxID=197161 RepID=UPI001ED87189|nr:RAB6A-GEF complex partner protein 2 isoform X1 [Ischnura elegans]